MLGLGNPHDHRTGCRAPQVNLHATWQKVGAEVYNLLATAKLLLIVQRRESLGASEAVDRSSLMSLLHDLET